MKAFISRDTIIKLITDHTVFSKANDIPAHFRWYSFDGGFLTWDFAMMDRVLVDVEIEPMQPLNTLQADTDREATLRYAREYSENMRRVMADISADMSDIVKSYDGKQYEEMTVDELKMVAMEIEIEMAESKLELAKISKYLMTARERS